MIEENRISQYDEIDLSDQRYVECHSQKVRSTAVGQLIDVDLYSQVISIEENFVNNHPTNVEKAETKSMQ